MPSVKEGKTHWRVRLSGQLRPYARILAAAALLLMVLPLADTFLGWGLFGLSERGAWGLALGIGLVWYICVFR